MRFLKFLAKSFIITVLAGALGLAQLSFIIFLTPVAHAATVTYSVPWATDLEGFSWTLESCNGTCTQNHTSGDGNPAGSTFARIELRNKKSSGYWQKTLTWENMGVPAGATVNNVDGRFDVKLFQETHSATHAVGLKLFDSGNTVTVLEGGVVDVETEFDPTSSSWITRNTDGAKNVAASYQASNTSLTVRMRIDVNSGNNNSAASEIRVDNVVFVIDYTVPATTTLGSGTDPAAATVAPESAIRDAGAFTYQTSAGTDSLTALTISLAGSGTPYDGLAEARITSDNGATTYFSAVTSFSSNTVNFSGGTAIPVTTTQTQFKIRLTPKTHANMPVPPGASYNFTARVTGWTGTNAQAGSDSNANTLTYDNTSPNTATSVSGSAGDAAVTINWTTSNSADFDTTNGSVVLRWAAGTAGAEVPAEGNSSYSAGNAIGAATVACVISSAASAAQSKVDGTGGSAGCTTSALTNGQQYTYKVFQRDTRGNYNVGVVIGTFTPASATPTLTISVTAGSKVTTRNSGDADQYAHNTACTGAATCAAFTLAASGGTVNVTSIKITESGTATANTELSDLNLYYDFDGNWSDVGAETLFGTAANFAADQTATVSGTLAVTSGATAYIYVRYDLANGTTYPQGGATVNFQIAAATDVVSDGDETGSGTLAGTQTVLPTADSVTYAAGGDGGRTGSSATISGKGFGAPSVNADKQDCSTATVGSKGCVRFIVGGNYTILGSDISTWNNTTIAFTVNTSITTFGGVASLEVVAAAQNTATDLTYYIYPNITSITVCDKSGFPADAGREYNAGDSACPNSLTDGQIQLNGTRFDTSGNQGTIDFVGGFGTVSATIDSWSDTMVQVRVPDVSNSVYLGDIRLTRAAATASKTGLAYGGNGFRVLPRITGFNPASAARNAAVQVQGDHFCQNGGACPGAFDANNKVTFTSSADATVFTGWTNTAMDTQVPGAAITGDVVLKSNGFDSNPLSFTVLIPDPSTPTTLKQARNAGITDLISIGGIASSTPVYFSMETSSGITGGTMYMQTEIRPTIGANSTFTDTCTSNPYCFEGPGFAYAGGTLTASSSTSTVDELYHWQTRTRYNYSGSDYYSAWQCYPDTGCNAETATDLKLDTVAPSITSLNSSGITANTATITWNTTGDPSSSQVAYGTDSTLATNTATTTEADLSPTVTAHSVELSNLSCGTTYYYRARSRDDAGITTFSAIQNFATVSCPTDPAKTATFFITGKTGVITNGTPLSEAFSVSIPENATTTKSAFIELTGVFTSGASSKDLVVQVNSEPARTYILPASSTSHFRIMHRVATVNADNTLAVTPQTNTTVSITSARLIITYAYTP